jgi:hypothetical protein
MALQDNLGQQAALCSQLQRVHGPAVLQAVCVWYGRAQQQAACTWQQLASVWQYMAAYSLQTVCMAAACQPAASAQQRGALQGGTCTCITATATHASWNMPSFSSAVIAGSPGRPATATGARTGSRKQQPRPTAGAAAGYYLSTGTNSSRRRQGWLAQPLAVGATSM